MNVNPQSLPRSVGILFVPVALAFVTACVKSTPSQSSSTTTQTGQIWEVTFEDSMHPQTVVVYVSPFTYSGTWGETGASSGLWMFSPDGSCQYQMKVGGNIVHDSPGDRWSTVNLGGAGCGMQTIGSCQLTSSGNFPDSTTASGTYTLTTTSPLGTVSGSNTVTAHRVQ